MEKLNILTDEGRISGKRNNRAKTYKVKGEGCKRENNVQFIRKEDKREKRRMIEKQNM